MKLTTLFSTAVLALPTARAYTPIPKLYSFGTDSSKPAQFEVTIQFPNPQPVPNKQLGIAFYLTKNDTLIRPSVSTFVEGFDTSVSKFYAPKGSVLEHTFTIYANWTGAHWLTAVNWYQWTGNSSFGTATDSILVAGTGGLGP